MNQVKVGQKYSEEIKMSNAKSIYSYMELYMDINLYIKISIQKPLHKTVT